MTFSSESTVALLSGVVSRNLLQAERPKMAVAARMYDILNVLMSFLVLKSEFKCQSELLRHRNSHTSGVEELRILSVQLLVSIDEEKVRSLQLERHRVHLHRLYDLGRQLIGKEISFILMKSPLAMRSVE